MPKQTVSFLCDIPDGWKVVGYRPPADGEHYLVHDGEVEESIANSLYPWIILEKIVTFRDAVMPADYGKECLFSDTLSEPNPHEGELRGCLETYNHCWVDQDGDTWRYAKIAE